MMFSYVFSVVLITTIAVFHSSHAATKIFTIVEQSPSITGAFGERLMNEDMVPGELVNRLSKMVTLNTLNSETQKLNYFGTESGNIFIHYNGFISVDSTSKMNLEDIPNQFRAELQEANNFMAIYWQQYKTGDVYNFTYQQNNPEKNTLTSTQLGFIAADINKALGSDANTDFKKRIDDNRKCLKIRTEIAPDEITDVYVFTWLRMRDNPTSRKSNTFQALLVRVDNMEGIKWYLKIYFAALDTNGIIDGTRDDKELFTKIAQIGVGIQLGEGDQNKISRIDFQQKFGTTLPTIYELVSNEYDFLQQSSYTFDLNSDAQYQPTPPNVICKSQNCFKSQEAQRERGNRGIGGRATGAPGQTAQPITTTPSTTFSPEDIRMDLERFCLFRDDGEHALPANCDVFIYCSNGVGSFAFCPNGTKFNPVFLTCDHPVNHECRFETLEGLQPLFTQPPSVSNNLCFFQGFGDVADPSSCGHYYSCTNTRSIRMPCPADLYFRPITAESGECDYPRNVECVNGVRPDSNLNTNSNTTTTEATTTTRKTTSTNATKYHPRNIH